MRLKRNIILFFLFFVFIFFRETKVVSACECGELCENCTTTTFQSSSWFECPAGQGIVIDCQDNAGSAGSYSNGDPYWNPVGSPTTVCTNTCDDQSPINTVTECYDYIGSCPVSPTPNPTNNPNDPNPTSDPNPTPTAAPTPVIISGNINLDIDAALSGSFCSQSSDSPIAVSGSSLYATNAGNTYQSLLLGNNFTINTFSSGNNYTVTLDLSAQTGVTNYSCSCPAALSPSNPYLCQYTGVGSPTGNVNFYLQEYNLSNDSWFQVFGGNLFGRSSINTNVPYTFCVADGNCQAALSVPKVGSTNEKSSGFPISNAINSNNIKSSSFSTVQHSYFHLTDRTSNVNSYGLNTDLGQLSYDYFYKLAENSTQQIGNGEDLEPLLSDWTGSAWWSSTDINYVKVNGNVSIDETQGFNLSSNQKLVVFVDGNLTFDDSNVNDGNRKITSVAEGGFLAFFVSGNILITPKVGYELNPSIPTVPTVTNANSNLEGVFVANGSLTVQSKTAIGEVPPDKKFIGAGTFVGWTAVNLDRTFDDGSFGPILNNNQAIENFFYRPDLLANWPTKLKASVSNWREVDPQLINQQ